jgi:ferredoxin
MLQEAENLQENSRLSCQCLVEDDLVVNIPPSDFDDEDLI